MELNIFVQGEEARFQLVGAVDEKGAERLKSAFGETSLDNLKVVTFDFSAVNFIGSAGLGKLLLFYKKLSSSGIKMRVENTCADVHALLQELRLDALFTVT